MKIFKVIAIMFVTCLFTACGNDNDENNTEEFDNKTINHQAVGDYLSMDIDIALSNALTENKIMPTNAAACTPAVDINLTTKTIKIDFGTGCTGSDGILRKGLLTATATTIIPQVGTIYTINTTNYEVNGYKLAGQIKKTVREYNQVKNIITKAEITENVTITYPQGLVIVRTINANRGYNITTSDIVVSTNGTASVTEGTVKINYTVNSSNPLIYSVKNNEVVKGIMQIQKDGTGIVWTIDYGNGTPDNTITISDGKQTWTITITK